MSKLQPVSSGSLAGEVRNETAFPSGRRLVLASEGGQERLEVRSPGNDLELAIEFTERGPIVRIRAAELEIESSDKIAMRCREFELATTDGLRLSAGGELAVRSAGELKLKSDAEAYIDADMVNLNCGDRAGYHDEGVDHDQTADDEDVADDDAD